MTRILFPGWAVPVDAYHSRFPDTQILDWGFFHNDHPSVPLKPLPELPGPCTLIGHSLGTLLAIQTALAHPEKVSELILYAPFLRFTAGSGIPGHPAEVVESMIRQCETSPGLMLKAFWRNLFFPLKTPSEWSAQIPCDSEKLAEGLRVLRDADLSQCFPLLRLSQLTFRWGGKDKIVTAEMNAALLSALPQSAVCECHHNAGHALIFG